MIETKEKQTVNVFNIAVNATTMRDAISQLEKRTGISDLSGQYVCFLNVHTVVMAHDNSKYMQVMQESGIVYPDGMPIAKEVKKQFFKKRGKNTNVYPERVSGPDFLLEILAHSEKNNWTHFFYGASEETLAKIKIQLLEKYPNLQIKGMISPPYRELTEKEDAADIERIKEADADFIWIGLGAPKQESWMYVHREMFRGIMFGVGAAFDFMAGNVKRAPRWMQKCSLEWLYRLIQDPKRLWKRYFRTNLRFIWLKATKRNVEDRKENMNIAMLGHKRIPSREGGIEIVVEELATRMVKFGHSVTCYNRKGHHVSGKEFDCEQLTDYKGVRLKSVFAINKRGLAAMTSSIIGAFCVAFGKYDVVHFHAEGPCIMLWLPKLFGKRCVVTIHGLDHQRKKWGRFASKYIMLGEKCAARYADEIIVLSEGVQNYFMKTYGRKTSFIPNGVNRPQIREANIIKQKYNLEKDSYILFLGRLVPEKGLRCLIEAFKNVKTDKKLVIAGGSSDTKKFADELKTIAQDDKRIIFTGFIQGQELDEQFSNAYVYTLPSDLEGMPLSLLEAMSYGNCCLISDIDECVSVVEDRAFIFHRGNVLDLQEKLQMLCDDEDLVAKCKQSTANFICEKYVWDDVTKKTIELYKK